MFLLLFIITSVAFGLVLWTDKKYLSMIVFSATLIFALILLLHDMTDTLNVIL